MDNLYTWPFDREKSDVSDNDTKKPSSKKHIIVIVNKISDIMYDHLIRCTIWYGNLWGRYCTDIDK